MSSRILCLLTISVLGMLGCRDQPTTPAVVSESPLSTDETGSDVEKEFSLHHFGDFAFAIPEGWSVVTPDRDKTKAMILLDGTNWQNAKAMIKVDVGTPAAATAEELAHGFAEGTGGTVASEPLDFDGTLGIKASTPSVTLATPRNMIVIFRGNQVYLLMAAAVEGAELAETVAHIRETWTWVD